MILNSLYFADRFCGERLDSLVEIYGRNMLRAAAAKEAILNELVTRGQEFAEKHGIKAGFCFGQVGNTAYPYDLMIYDEEKLLGDDTDENRMRFRPEDMERHMIAGIAVFRERELAMMRYMNIKAKEIQEKDPDVRLAAFTVLAGSGIPADSDSAQAVTEDTYVPMVYPVRSYSVFPERCIVAFTKNDVIGKFLEWVFSGYTGDEGKGADTEKTA